VEETKLEVCGNECDDVCSDAPLVVAAPGGTVPDVEVTGPMLAARALR